MIGAKLDGETQRKKLISTRHPKQAAKNNKLKEKHKTKKRKDEKSSIYIGSLDDVVLGNGTEAF